MERLGTIFANNLRECRRKNGFTQEKLAELVNVSTHHIGMLEIAHCFPTLDLVERLAQALNIEIYELFVDPRSPKEEMEKLRLSIIEEIKQTIDESIQKALCVDVKRGEKA